MRKLLNFILLSFLSLSLFAQDHPIPPPDPFMIRDSLNQNPQRESFIKKISKAHPLRWYPFEETQKVTHNGKYGDVEQAFKDSTIFFAPSVAFDVFYKEGYTGNYNVGVIPGVGYGIKYNPFKWKDNYLVGLDVFASGALDATSSSPQYFNVKILPVLTLLNWIHVGYGPEFKMGSTGTKT